MIPISSDWIFHKQKNKREATWVSRVVRHRAVADPIPSSHCKDNNNFQNTKNNMKEKIKTWSFN